MSDYDVSDELLVPVIAGLLHKHVRSVRDSYGPLPRLRSSEFADAPEDVQLAVLVLLGSAWTWGTPGLAVLRDVARDIRGTQPQFSRHRPSFDELQHHRGLRFDDQQRRWEVA